MNVVWGLVLIVLGALAWGGQFFSWLAPVPAARLGLTDHEDDVEPVIWADGRGEAVWDSFTLWTLIVAGALLIADSTAWASWGLIGGGVYGYFGGRGILTRFQMRGRGFAIGPPATVRIAITALAVWGIVGLITLAAAFAQLN